MLVTLHIYAAYRKVKKISVKRYLAVKIAITVDLRTWNSVDEVKPSKHYSAVDQPDTQHVGSGLTTGSYGMLRYTTRLLTITIRLAEQISNSITFKEIIFLLNFTDGGNTDILKILKERAGRKPLSHLSISIQIYTYIICMILHILPVLDTYVFNRKTSRFIIIYGKWQSTRCKMDK